MSLFSVAALGLLGWAVGIAIVSLEALRRFARRSRQARALAPRGGAAGYPGGSSEKRDAEVLLVRPCAGDEPHLERALVSLRGAFCSSRVRCRFAIAPATRSSPSTAAAASAVSCAPPTASSAATSR